MVTIVGTTSSPTRWASVADQLQYAISRTELRALEEWLADALLHTGKVGIRRVSNFGNLIRRVGGRLLAEGEELVDAYEQERFFASLRDQSFRAGREVSDVASRLGNQFREFALATRESSRLPEAVVLVAAAVVTSGGFDADGGVPDLDLSLGIGAHRSIFTHSIISGTLVEGSLYAACTLVGLVYRELPSEHDRLFDLIEENRERYLHAATAGSSAGIAYHLAMDAALQPGTYHDLPFSMPMEGHQILTGANAAAEGHDVNKKAYATRSAKEKRSFVEIERRAPQTVSRPSANTSHHKKLPNIPTSGKEGSFTIDAERTSIDDRGRIPDAVKRGTSRQLWFAWLHQDDGTKRAVILVPDEEAHAKGDVRLFFGDARILVTRKQVDIWPHLTSLLDDEQSLRKVLVANYRAILKPHRL